MVTFMRLRLVVTGWIHAVMTSCHVPNIFKMMLVRAHLFIVVTGFTLQRDSDSIHVTAVIAIVMASCYIDIGRRLGQYHGEGKSIRK